MYEEQSSARNAKKRVPLVENRNARALTFERVSSRFRNGEKKRGGGGKHSARTRNDE